MTDYNNFHMYFPPNGVYRRMKPDVTLALDEVLENVSFDFPKFERAMAEQRRLFEDYRQFWRKIAAEKRKELAPEEKEWERKITITSEATNEVLDGMLKPVYDRMRAKGFSHKELIA